MLPSASPAENTGRGLDDGEPVTTTGGGKAATSTKGTVVAAGERRTEDDAAEGEAWANAGPGGEERRDEFPPWWRRVLAGPSAPGNISLFLPPRSVPDIYTPFAAKNEEITAPGFSSSL